MRLDQTEKPLPTRPLMVFESGIPDASVGCCAWAEAPRNCVAMLMV
jgi:hypothetical protein